MASPGQYAGFDHFSKEIDLEFENFKIYVNVIQGLVSIIIPYYNSEGYLEDCLSSVCGQTYDRTEVILVNDGSTDSSSQIAFKFADKYDNVILREIANSGPGEARNHGLLHAQGEYIIFVDSDDLIAPVMVEEMLRAIQLSEADVCMCKFALFDGESEEIYEKAWCMESPNITGIEAIKGMYSNKITLTVWGKIFKSAMLRNIKFPVGRIYEDRPFMLEAFYKSQKVHFADKVLMRIRKRSGSLTRSPISPKKIQDLSYIHELEVDFITKHKLSWAKKLLNRYHILWLRLSFFILRDDEKRAPECRGVRPVLISHIKKFQNEASPLSIKDRTHLRLLGLPSLIGWSSARKLLSILYSK